jgi:hypothetical protein
MLIGALCKILKNIKKTYYQPATRFAVEKSDCFINIYFLKKFFRPGEYTQITIR